MSRPGTTGCAEDAPSGPWRRSRPETRVVASGIQRLRPDAGARPPGSESSATSAPSSRRHDADGRRPSPGSSRARPRPSGRPAESSGTLDQLPATRSCGLACRRGGSSRRRSAPGSPTRRRSSGRPASSSGSRRRRRRRSPGARRCRRGSAIQTSKCAAPVRAPEELLAVRAVGRIPVVAAPNVSRRTAPLASSSSQMSRLPPRSELKTTRACRRARTTGCRSTLAPPRQRTREGVAPSRGLRTSGHSARFWVGDERRPTTIRPARRRRAERQRILQRERASAAIRAAATRRRTGCRRARTGMAASATTRPPSPSHAPPLEQGPRAGWTDRGRRPRSWRRTSTIDAGAAKFARSSVQGADRRAVRRPARRRGARSQSRGRPSALVAVGREVRRVSATPSRTEARRRGRSAGRRATSRRARDVVGDATGLAADGRDAEELERRRRPAQNEQRAAVGREPGRRVGGPGGERHLFAGRELLQPDARACRRASR